MILEQIKGPQDIKQMSLEELDVYKRQAFSG